MPPRFKPHIFVPLLILVVAIAGFAALMASKPRSQAALRKETVWSVAVQIATPRAHRPVLSLFGRVESPRRSRLRAAVEAAISSVNVKEGEEVDEGQVLMTLDDRELVALLEQRKADVRDAEAAVASEAVRYANDRRAVVQEEALLNLAQAEVKRAENLLRQKLGSEAQVDSARQNLVRQQLALDNRQQSIADHANRNTQVEARLARAKAQREVTELDLQQSRIAAPFRARVAKVPVALGDRVRVGDSLVELYDLSALEVRAQIPDSQIEPVRRALDAGERLEATGTADGVDIELRLDRLAGEVAKGSGGIEGLFSVPAEADWLAVGRFVNVRLRLPEVPGVVALPRQALYGKDRVYQVVDDRLQPVTVSYLGSRSAANGEEEILVKSDAVKAGDRIVVTQLPNAIEGLRVRAIVATAQ